MCPPKKQVNDFALKINESILSGNVALVPEQITEFEKKGYSVFYRAIPKEQLNDSFQEFWKKEASEASALREGKSYQGTLIFTPIVNNNNLKEIMLNKSHPLTRAYCFIADTSLKINNNECCLGHYYDKKKKPLFSKDENIYVMIVYKMEI